MSLESDASNHVSRPLWDDAQQLRNIVGKANEANANVFVKGLHGSLVGEVKVA